MSAASRCVTGIGGMVEPGLTDGGLRMKAASTSGRFGRVPAIKPTSSNRSQSPFWPVNSGYLVTRAAPCLAYRDEASVDRGGVGLVTSVDWIFATGQDKANGQGETCRRARRNPAPCSPMPHRRWEPEKPWSRSHCRCLFVHPHSCPQLCSRHLSRAARPQRSPTLLTIRESSSPCREATRAQPWLATPVMG